VEERHRPMTFIEDWTGQACVRCGITEFLLHACFGPTWVTMTSVLFRRRLLEAVGPFPSDLGPVGDTAWAMRAALVSDTAYVPGRWATWRRRKDQASRPIKDRASYRMMLDCVRSVVNDRRVAVPDKWKATSGWRSAITAVWAREYYRTFGLYRGNLRRDPVTFLQNLSTALVFEPRFVFEHAVRGGRRPANLTYDRIQTARKLIELFEAPWPPTPIRTGWSEIRAGR
jgi:hypothetical protein